MFQVPETTMQKIWWASLYCALFFTLLPSAAVGQILSRLDAQDIDKAIQLAADERAAGVFLDRTRFKLAQAGVMARSLAV